MSQLFQPVSVVNVNILLVSVQPYTETGKVILTVRISKVIQKFPLVSSFLTAKSGKFLMNTGIDGNIPLSYNLKRIFACKCGLNMFRQRFGFEYLIASQLKTAIAQGISGESKDFFSEIEKIDTNKRED